MKLIKIEYILNNNNWKCNIIGKDAKDAIEFLEKYLRATFSIISTEEVCDIHGISSSAMAMFNIGNTNIKEEKRKGPGRPSKNK